jgi:hypothetical protein
MKEMMDRRTLPWDAPAHTPWCTLKTPPTSQKKLVAIVFDSCPSLHTNLGILLSVSFV